MVFATNVLRNQRRSLRRHRAALERIAAAGEGPVVVDAAERVAAEQEARSTLALISRLPQREQDVIALCIWSELSYEEAALALGVPVGTVRSRLARARARLRELVALAGHSAIGESKSGVVNDAR